MQLDFKGLACLFLTQVKHLHELGYYLEQQQHEAISKTDGSWKDEESSHPRSTLQV